MIKKTIVILACSALLAPLAVAKTRSTHKRHTTTTTTEQPIIVTGTIIPAAIEQGAAASYQPAQTLVVRVDGTSDSRRYVLNGPGYVVNAYGQVIRTALRPGTHVHVYYVNVGDLRMVDHVIVD